MADTNEKRVVVVGAGVGGLATAIRLAANGCQVTLIDRHSHAGGKMRTTDSVAGPVDRGPTVLTMRWVFDDLFQAAGEKLASHVPLERDMILARHFWRDGSTLDLHADPEASADAVGAFAGRRAAKQFRKFSDEARALFETFRGPMMEAPEPNQAALTSAVLRRPGLVPSMAPGLTLAAKLARRFTDKRLQQLFGRYATYVGGSPYRSPALLSLIWHAEAEGIWRVAGGMGALAKAMSDLFVKKGGTLNLGDGAARIESQGGQVVAVHTDAGLRLPAECVVFAGDPRALAKGRLGPAAAAAATADQTEPRSLSAWVFAYAAEPSGPELAHHNVFFADDPKAEFGALEKGARPEDGTLYVCAQDRGGASGPEGAERFEIILNGAPDETAQSRPRQSLEKEKAACQTQVFARLKDFGLRFTPTPGTEALTAPWEFAADFPNSAGSLYGPSPHGTFAALKKPRARTPVKGLYLAGGGVHPGAGVPMATLSGKHAAEAILTDLASTSTSRPTAMPGGTSTGSGTTANGLSRSLAS
ncbi:MAG: 1-hydroxycarotenoid 3,4-desaturase CrtD [Pseudomonadota bacterium]